MLRTVVRGRGMQNWLQQFWRQYRWMALMINHDTRGAVYLSDWVVVLSARAATVRRQLPVPPPRPRQLSMVTSPEFAAVEQEVLEVLYEESRRALVQQETPTPG